MACGFFDEHEVPTRKSRKLRVSAELNVEAVTRHSCMAIFSIVKRIIQIKLLPTPGTD